MSKKFTADYFPRMWTYSAPLIFITGAGFGSINLWLLGAITIFFIALFATTKYVTEIDVEKQSYNDYLSLLGIRVNQEKGSYKAIDRIIITKGNYAQTVNTRVQSRQMNWSDYTATVIFDSGKLDLATRNSKKELLMEIKPISDHLSVDVEDRTSAQAYLIDMSKVS